MFNFLQFSRQVVLTFVLFCLNFFVSLRVFSFRVELLCAKLKDKNWPAEFIAAQLHQSQRSNVMKRLKNFRCRILVSTDLVINFFKQIFFQRN